MEAMFMIALRIDTYHCSNTIHNHTQTMEDRQGMVYEAAMHIRNLRMLGREGRGLTSAILVMCMVSQ